MTPYPQLQLVCYLMLSDILHALEHDHRFSEKNSLIKDSLTNQSRSNLPESSKLPPTLIPSLLHFSYAVSWLSCTMGMGAKSWQSCAVMIGAKSCLAFGVGMNAATSLSCGMVMVAVSQVFEGEQKCAASWVSSAISLGAISWVASGVDLGHHGLSW